MIPEVISAEWLGKRVKAEYGLQTALAKHMGVDKSVVNKMVHKRRTITQEDAAKIRSFFEQYSHDDAQLDGGNSAKSGSSSPTGLKAQKLPDNVERCIDVIVREFDPELTVLALQKSEHALVKEAVEIFVRLNAPEAHRAKDVETLLEIFDLKANGQQPRSL